ncbi:amidohydrolase family protein [Lentisphaerota bacterium ZTH]|nr:amidohydrolase family protein [Lentisphaerota bacterium]WET05723.1 amidohydrolase family protein [Lentisphaerota bacterium ZTH]
MFIDAHAHAVRKPYYRGKNNAPFPTAEQLDNYYAKAGIEKACLLPLIGPEFFLPQSNEDILDMAEKFERFVPFCNIHPFAVDHSADADLADLMKHYRDLGCRGIGEVICLLPFDNPFVYNFFKCAQDARLPVTVHIAHRHDRVYGLYDTPGLPGLEETLSRFEDLIIVGHSQTFWAEIAELDTVNDRSGYPAYPVREEGAVPRIMRKHPNLYADLSAGSGFNALNRDHNYAVKFLNEFQDRLMFGLDICADPATANISGLKKLLEDFRGEKKISAEVFEKIASGNASRLYNI